MNNTWPIEVLAFDADDTLWDCQGHFDEVEKAYCQLLNQYADEDTISESLFETEMANMFLLGYGSKAFTISLVENAVKVSEGRLTANETMQIISLGKHLLQLPGTPLPGVQDTLEKLRSKWQYRMVVFTKGDNLEQEGKFKRSGLQTLFDDFVVVSDKTSKAYQRLCRLFDISMDRLCMIGNSYKSDIQPVLQLGGYAVHIPYALTWQHEQAEAKPHPHLKTIRQFSELINTL